MPTPADAEVPRSIALLWGLDQPGGRGPKRGLSLDQVLAAAVAVADAEGFEALSMTRVAQELGFTAMSLYRYVDSKSTLLDLLLDRVIGLPPRIEPGTPWRAGLEQWARAEAEIISRHPWWLDLPMTGPPLGPNNMTWLETGLTILGSTGLPEPVKLQLVMNLSFFVIGRMRSSRSVQVSTENGENTDAVLTHMLDPQRFPALTAAFAAQAFEDDEIDWEELDFNFGLARLLDGYERYVQAFARR